MNKKIKVIELLIEISKGNVKHGTKFNVLYKNNLKRKVYYDANEPNAFSCIKNVSDDLPIYDEVRFNEEVEILDDEEEIDIKMCEPEWFEQHRLEMNEVECDLAMKINEIINYLLKLDKKINKE